MKDSKNITPSILVNELETSYFKKYIPDIEKVLNLKYNESFDEQIEAARSCLGLFWEKYYSKNVADILETFPKVQKALFGLEEDFSKGSRYRDHYVHMFDVFITGSRIISQILNSIEIKNRNYILEKVFKVVEESKDIPFPRPYNSIERVFFLWVLSATFHDIGIPVEHLGNIKNGLNGFLKFFGLKIDTMLPTRDTNLLTQINYYVELMSSFSDTSIINDNNVYEKSERPNDYLKHSLSREFSENNHSVISGICLYNSFIETFLIGNHENKEYNLTKEKYSDFICKVLEQDISRAALAISYHNLSSKKYPKLFPIDPNKLPLTFLLILCDEIQEAFRHEGINYIGLSKLTTLPDIRVTQIHDEKNSVIFNIRIDICYIKLPEENMVAILGSLNNWAIYTNAKNVPSTYEELIKYTWDNIFLVLENKLLLGSEPFEVEIHVFYENNSKKANAKTQICSKEWLYSIEQDETSPEVIRGKL